MKTKNTAALGALEYGKRYIGKDAGELVVAALLPPLVYLLAAPLAAIFGGSGQNALIGAGIAGAAALAIITLIEMFSQFQLNFKLALALGGTRRRSLAATWLIALLFGGAGCALLMLTETAALALTGLPSGDALLRGMPVWIWAALVLLPTGYSAFSAAITLRFGQRGSQFVTFFFIALCWAPSLLFQALDLPKGTLTALLPYLPHLLLGLAAALAAVATALLARASIRR